MYTLTISELVRLHVIAKSRDWFAFRCVAFGLPSGPLLWCRPSALPSGLAQSLLSQNELRLQTYVDDPARAFMGQPREHRSRLLSHPVVLLLCKRISIELGR